jgi:hypothetical protein
MSMEEFGDLFFVVRDVRQKFFELLDIAIHIPGRGSDPSSEGQFETTYTFPPLGYRRRVVSSSRFLRSNSMLVNVTGVDTGSLVRTDVSRRQINQEITLPETAGMVIGDPTIDATQALQALMST